MEFNNLRCVALDRSFLNFEYCYLKSVNRTFKYASLKTKLHQLPIDNCMVRSCSPFWWGVPQAAQYSSDPGSDQEAGEQADPVQLRHQGGWLQVYEGALQRHRQLAVPDHCALHKHKPHLSLRCEWERVLHIHIVLEHNSDRFFPFPVQHDIILDKLPVQHVNRLVQSVIPDGRYYLNTTWVVDSIPRAEAIIYFTKSWDTGTRNIYFQLITLSTNHL